MTARRLKIHHHPAPHHSHRPPLLFVHGGYTNSRCWEHNFIPYFQQKGYDCHALDLSGHGESAGHERLHHFGIRDYAHDVAHAVGELPARPVLIGHSMGTLVIRHYLSGAPADSAAGVALLSPVPPTGTGGSASRLALQQPDFFTEIPNVIAGKPTANTLKVMASVYFSPDMRPEDTLQFMPMIGNESDQAVAEMVALPFTPAPPHPAAAGLRDGRQPRRGVPGLDAVLHRAALARPAGHHRPRRPHADARPPVAAGRRRAAALAGRPAPAGGLSPQAGAHPAAVECH